MYTADHADIDPRNPANLTENKFNFIVADYKIGPKGNSKTTDLLGQDFTSEDSAKDALLSLTAFLGEELTVVRNDDEGDSMAVFCAVWDDEKSGYVGA